MRFKQARRPDHLDHWEQIGQPRPPGSPVCLKLQYAKFAKQTNKQNDSQQQFEEKTFIQNNNLQNRKEGVLIDNLQYCCRILKFAKTCTEQQSKNFYKNMIYLLNNCSEKQIIKFAKKLK